MFGYFRFILATLVMLSHTAGYWGSFHYGVAAVVIFFMLAGHVVCKLLLEVFERGKTLVIRFYIERLLRIFPLYLFVLSVTVVFVIVADFGESRFTVVNVINSLLIVPLNYYMFFENINNLRPLTNPDFFLVPTAWSLGAELQAYLILPFVIFMKPIKVISGILSLIVFIIASIGIISPDFYGYRLLPGILFIFIIGTCIFINQHKGEKADSFDKYYPLFSFFILVMLLFYLGYNDKLQERFVRETILGTMIGMPIVIFCSKYNQKIKLDHLLADMSYGLFLSHFLAKWLLDFSCLITIQENKWLYISTIYILSLGISIIGILLVEKRLKKMRSRLLKEGY